MAAAGRALLSVVLVAYYDSCERYECPVAFWVSRADAFAAAIRAASGRDARVDAFTNCRPAGAWRSARGTRVAVHARVPEALNASVSAYASAQQHRKMTRCLYKLLALGRDDVSFSLILDADVDAWPPELERAPNRAAAQWVAAMRRMEASGWVLGSMADAASPINGGIVLVRPHPRLYAEALATLALGGGAFNSTHGWGLLGSPRAVVPREDPAWELGVEEGGGLLVRDSWAYHGARVDQGLWFHLTRVRTRLGIDLACLLPPRPAAGPAAGRDAAEGPSYYFYHFFRKVFHQSCDSARAMGRGRLVMLDTHLGEMAAALPPDGSDEAVAPRRVASACAATYQRAHTCVRAALQGLPPPARKRARGAPTPPLPQVHTYANGWRPRPLRPFEHEQRAVVCARADHAAARVGAEGRRRAMMMS